MKEELGAETDDEAKEIVKRVFINIEIINFEHIVAEKI